MASPQTTYVQSTNVTQPDPTTAAWRNAVSGNLISEAGKVPDVYGSKWVPLNATLPDGSPDPNAGRFIRDTSTPLTAGTNPFIESYLASAGGGTGTANYGLGQAAAMYHGAGEAAGGIAGAGAGAWGQAGQNFQGAAAGQSGLAGQGQFNAATGRFDQAADTNTSAQFQPYGAVASNLYGQSTAPTGLAAASPYLQAASGNTPDNIGAYMNPYNQQVTDRIAQLGARNLSENLLPSISDDFVRAGGYGGTRQRDLYGRALRDTQESVLAQQGQLLQSGYGLAGQQYASDAARQAGLAGTAGGLGTSQQQILQGAASGLGNVGSTYAGLSGADASRQLAAGQGLMGIGQTNIQASQADLARQLAAAQGQVGLGTAQSDAMAKQAEQQRLAGAGFQGLGMDTQKASVNDQNAILNAGSVQQGLGQAGIDAEKARLETGNTAVINQIGASGNALTSGGQGGGTTTGASTTTAPGGSTLGQLAGAAGTVIAGANLLKAKGGAVKKKPHSRVSYGNVPRRGIGMFARAS